MWSSTSCERKRFEAVDLAEARLETGDRVLLQREFPRRQQADGVHLVDGALVFRIEGTQGKLISHPTTPEQNAARYILRRFVCAKVKGIDMDRHN